MVRFIPQMQEASHCHLQNRFKHIGVALTSDEQLESQMSGWFSGASVKMQALSENWRQKAELFITLYFCDTFILKLSENDRHSNTSLS